MAVEWSSGVSIIGEEFVKRVYMLSRLLKPKAELVLEAPKGTMVSEMIPCFYRGDTMKLSISLLPQEPFYVQEWKIELVCFRSFEATREARATNKSFLLPQVRKTNRSSFLSEVRGTNNSIWVPYDTTEHKWITTVIFRESLQLMANKSALQGVPYRKDVGFTLPESVELSSKGTIDWEIKVSIDVKGRRNINKAWDIVVRRARPMVKHLKDEVSGDWQPSETPRGPFPKFVPCKGCGRKVDSKAIMCPKCGTPVGYK